MKKFWENPAKTLDLAQTLALIAEPGDFMSSQDAFRVKSQPICDLLDSMESQGFVYNVDGQRRFEELHGVGPFPENSVLGTLVYNAQHYRRRDQLIREGFVPCDETVLREAFQKKMKLRLESGEVANVRLIGEKLHAMLPNKRKYALMIEGDPVKLVKA